MCSRWYFWYFGSTLLLLQVDRVGTMKNEEELRLELIRVRQELPTDAMKYIVLDGKGKEDDRRDDRRYYRRTTGGTTGMVLSTVPSTFCCSNVLYS